MNKLLFFLSQVLLSLFVLAVQSWAIQMIWNDHLATDVFHSTALLTFGKAFGLLVMVRLFSGGVVIVSAND